MAMLVEITPGMSGVTKRLTRFVADKILRNACKHIGVEGVSTHSFRRTAVTQMSSAGIPLRTIQEISGHSDLLTLQHYKRGHARAEKESCLSDWVLDYVTYKSQVLAVDDHINIFY
ncbi:tyrosine-type recombinase/integrase [Nostoc sp.]|uniref:tyrosine-type recombinase/integrase n=1 Tax=Nostoc sp. TaxID=1180 RepID=UPI003FA5FB59